MRSQGSKKKVGPEASWGLGVPTPGCLWQRGGKATAQLAGHTGGRARATRTQGKARINLSRVLGSLPWLFEHLLAIKDGAGSKATTGSLWRPRPPDQGKAGQPRDERKTVPAQGLGCQRATYTLRWEAEARAHTGTRMALRPARVRPPAGSLALVGSAGMAHGEQGAAEAPRGHTGR